MPAEFASEDKKSKIKRSVEPAEKEKVHQKDHPTQEPREGGDTISALQNMVGNRAVQRMLAQRSGDGSFDLDQETEARINRQRGSGQTLDENVQGQLESSMGVDFSNVNVHTSPDADDLNKQLGAKAFTTGNDIFFREGQYDPHSSSGKELIAHEATHVVQQSSGAVGSGGGGMSVNAPGDVYEQEADSVAQSVTGDSDTAGADQMQEEMIQRQDIPEDEEEAVQMQDIPEDEEEAVQMQDIPEDEEEAVQMQAEPEEEEEEALQMQGMPEEEEEEALQRQAMSEGEEEEELVQAQEAPEDELQAKYDH